MAAASAGATSQLEGWVVGRSFYPCPLQTDFTRPPTVDECPGATTPVAQAVCDPGGQSTVELTRSDEFFYEHVTATIGPQTFDPRGAFQPFPSPGIRSESVGLPVGQLLSFDAQFTLASPWGLVVGTHHLVANGGNYGVCREFVGEPTGSDVFGPAPATGYFYIVNAGVLGYDATVNDVEDHGVAEAYLMNAYATCCDPDNPESVMIAAGHLFQGFGTIHGAEGTYGEDTTDESGEAVPLPGVTLTFADAGISVTAVITTSAPPAPSGFQLGDDPIFYDITADGFTGEVTVCIPYGAVPAGTEPRLMHYQDGAWQNVTTSFTGLPDQIVCGTVTSLSPFAAMFEPVGPSYTLSGPFQPVDAQPIENVAVAGRTIPVRFSLGGDFGLDVIADGYPSFVSTACSSGPTDTVEWTAENAAGLTYDSASGVYTYHWKTLKAWKGTCGTLTIQFLDGSELKADFRFK